MTEGIVVSEGRAMTLQFKAKSAQVDMIRKAEYERKLFQQIQARKNAQTL